MKLRGDGSKDQFRIAALAFLILASGLSVLFSPGWLILTLMFSGHDPHLAVVITILFCGLPVLGWFLFALRRPVAALTCGFIAFLAGIAWAVGVIVLSR